MNNYIVLDSYRYLTKTTWVPLTAKPASVRYNLSGTTDVTYGPAVPVEWAGQVIAPVTRAGAQWGTIDDLRVTLAKRQALDFYDHYDAYYSVHVLGQFIEESLMTMWDDVLNEFWIPIQLIKA